MRNYCADLVQNLCLHPCLPLEGKVSAKPTDEVIFKSVRSAHTSIIYYSFAGIAYELKSGSTKPIASGMGKISYLQGMTQCRNAMQNRFSPHLRHRADAISVSVTAPVRL